MPRSSWPALAALLLAVPLAAQAPDSALVRRALRLHRAVPMVDGHNDLSWRIRARGSDDYTLDAARNPMLSLDSFDLSRVQPGLMTDIPRLRAGGVGAQFLSTWVPNEVVHNGSARIELEQIDIVRRLAERYPRDVVLARTAAEVVRAHHEGKIALLIGIEGGHAIENSLPVLRAFYDAGARYMTLTHNTTLAWADAAMDTAAHNGLTPFGIEVVHEMNRLGMIVDVSHVSDKTFYDVLAVSGKPVIASHSSCRALSGVPRNMTDDMLRALARNGGVIGINFGDGFAGIPRPRSWP